MEKVKPMTRTNPTGQSLTFARGAGEHLPSAPILSERARRRALGPITLAAAIGAWGSVGGEARAEGELVPRQLGDTPAPYGYVEFLPPGYETSAPARYTLVLFLHGAGERGNGTSDLMPKLTVHGPPKQIKNGDTFWADGDVIVLAPQAPTDGWWDAGLLADFLDYAVDAYRIDSYRVIVTGISMGGGGTWDYTRAQGKKRLAAAVPICGASGPNDGSPFVGVPTWAFHAWGDGVVPRSNSIGWVDAVASATAGADVEGVLQGYPHAGGDTSQPAGEDMTARFDGSAWVWASGTEPSGSASPRLTLYPDGSHDSWTRTYDNEAVRGWLVGQRRPLPASLEEDDIVVDDLDDGASFEGTWTRSPDAPPFYGWDHRTAPGGAGVAATFSADLPEDGTWDVRLSFSPGDDRAVVPVTITHADGSETVEVDMQAGGDFGSLGAFRFEAGTPATVRLDGAAVQGLIVADAVAFRKIQGGGGAGGAGGGAGAGGGGGAGGDDASSSTGNGAGAGAGDGAGDGDGDDGGCSLRPISSGTSPAGILVAASALLAWSARRRRRAC
jgi:dienelactone hydrolase